MKRGGVWELARSRGNRSSAGGVYCCCGVWYVARGESFAVRRPEDEDEEEGDLCMFVLGFEGLSSVWDCGGEAEEEPARRSRSSRRRLSFLPRRC